jgi:hypothetical protein
METSTISQGRAEWPPASRRARPRRESKVAYRNAPTNTNTVRNNAGGPSNYPSSPEESISRHNARFQPQSSPGQVFNMDLTDYFNVQRAPAGSAGFPPVVHQTFQDDSSWYSVPTTTYTLASNPPSSPQYSSGNNAHSPRSVMSRISTNGQDMSWTSVNRPSSIEGTDLMLDMAMSDIDFGSYGSFNSNLLPTPSTAASDLSDGFIFPPANPGSFQVQKDNPDLALSSK